MTVRTINISQPFDALGVSKCLYCQLVAETSAAGLSLLTTVSPLHLPWVCIGGGESTAPVTAAEDLVIETVDGDQYWAGGPESVTPESE